MCLYVVTRFLICVYLDVFNKMFYFKLCKCRYRGKPILYIPGFKNSTLLPYCIPEKKLIPTCKTLVEIYSHRKGRRLTLSSAKGSSQKRQTDEYIHTKLQNTRPLTTMVLWEKLCCWKLYKHMISYDFLYLFLNQRTYVFSLMHRNYSHCKPVSISFLHIWQLSEIGPQLSLLLARFIASQKIKFLILQKQTPT